MKSTARFLLKLIYIPLILIVCIEVSFLIVGYRPYKNLDYKVRSSPAYPFKGSEEFGFQLNEGKFNITLNNKVSFTANHSKNGCRVSSNDSNFKLLENTVFLGCSFTYGYGVNYEETFASKIQAENDDIVIKNYAVPGYGTVQSLLQLPIILKEKSVSNVVLCISSYHLMRNTLSQEFRSNLRIGFANSSSEIENSMKGARFPYVRDTSLQILYENWDEIYKNLPLREYLASVNFIQNTRDRIQDEQIKDIEITSRMIDEMYRMCQEKGVKFMVVCLDDSEEMSIIEKSLNQIPWLNVSFNFNSKSLTFLPFDSHPNAKGHSYIHQKVSPFLKEVLAGNE